MTYRHDATYLLRSGRVGHECADDADGRRLCDRQVSSLKKVSVSVLDRKGSVYTEGSNMHRPAYLHVTQGREDNFVGGAEL